MSQEPEIIEAPETDELALLREENESLSADVDELRAQIEKLEGRNRLLWGGYQGAGGLAALILLGPSLVKAARGFFGKVGAGEEPIPREESADLFAAVVRRVVAVGALGLMVAGATPVLMYFQNQYFREQNAKIQQQIEAQAEDTRIVRRAQLLTAIYELSDCDQSQLEEGEDCPPKGPMRLRSEAVRALAQLDGTKVQLDGADLRDAVLSGANLRGGSLNQANLNGANLFSADLERAEIWYADLRGADLNAANLHGARLVGSSLHGSNLRFANLQNSVVFETILWGANLTGANLIGARFPGACLWDADLNAADLHGADLSNSGGLIETDLSQTCGDSETRIPEDLIRPEHWLDRPRRSGDINNEGCTPGMLPQ